MIICPDSPRVDYRTLLCSGGERELRAETCVVYIYTFWRSLSTVYSKLVRQMRVFGTLCGFCRCFYFCAGRREDNTTMNVSLRNKGKVCEGRGSGGRANDVAALMMNEE